MSKVCCYDFTINTKQKPPPANRQMTVFVNALRRFICKNKCIRKGLCLLRLNLGYKYNVLL